MTKEEMTDHDLRDLLENNSDHPLMKMFSNIVHADAEIIVVEWGDSSSGKLEYTEVFEVP